MLFVGYNENIELGGKIFHIQTQSLGVNNPIIVTIVFQAGAVVSSRKQSFVELLNFPNSDELVQERMRHQHTQMVKDVGSGKLRKELTEEEETAIITKFLLDWAEQE